MYFHQYLNMKIKNKFIFPLVASFLFVFYNNGVVMSGFAQQPSNQSERDQVVVYPLPTQFKVVDAGLSALLTWKAPGSSTQFLSSSPASLYKPIESIRQNTLFDIQSDMPREVKILGGGSKSLEYSQLLYDNGPIINSPGSGPDGTDLSILQNTSLGMSTHGAGIQFPYGNRVADEFVVTENWVVESFTFFTYQTGSGKVSTIEEAYMQIWNGNPASGGQIVWGNMTTNRISSTAWTNAYRMSETSTNTNRPVMSVTCATPGLQLLPGTYWVDFSMDGNLESGPWAIPITINGQSTTGNALHYDVTDGWKNFVDSGTNTNQGVPFIVQGVKGNGPVVSGTLVGYKILRNGEEIVTVGSQTLSYTDTGLAPGSYVYSLLALYGDPYPGTSTPLTTNTEIISPSGFPFEETWKTGTFEANNWTISPYPTNWMVAQDYGKPAPTAIFHWWPTLGNYSVSLLSNYIDASLSEQNLSLQFDVAVNSYTSTGLEKLRIYIWDGNTWVLLETISNNFSFNWDTRTYDVTQYALGKLTRIRFEAKGVNSSNLSNWLIDNIRLYEGPSSFQPHIGISPPSLEFWLPLGGTQTQTLQLSNTGQDPLFWNAAVQYVNPALKEKQPLSSAAATEATGQIISREEGFLNTTVDTAMLHYDNGYVNGIGLTGGGYFYAAVRFPASTTSLYSGYTLESVDIYIKDVPINSKLYVWGKGSAFSPGHILHTQPFTAFANSWNTIPLSGSIALTGQDIWIGYSVTHTPSQVPSGCDDGPEDPDGGWFSTNGAYWSRLASNDLNYNWNIRAFVRGSDYNWLNINSHSGVIAPGENINLTASVETANLGAGSYYANIVIPSNDPNSPMKTVPVALHVGVGLNEKEALTLNAYPLPANHELLVELPDNARFLRLVGPLGQIVFSKIVEREPLLRIETEKLKPGIYSLQLKNDQGESFYKTVIITH